MVGITLLRKGVLWVMIPSTCGTDAAQQGITSNWQEVPTTIPSKCRSNPPTLPSAWDQGKCASGAAKQLWNVSPNGTAMGGDLEMCRGQPAGQISCEKRHSAWASPHLLVSPGRITSINKLVLFLPGTGANPRLYSKLLESAASAGNFVVGLSYLSQPFAVSQSNAWCQAVQTPSSVSGCNQEMHERMLFGHVSQSLVGQSDAVWDVEFRDAVRTLLIGILESVVWGPLFIDKQTRDVIWERVIVSGHSQGAGHAAYLSYATGADAVLLSGPQDCRACAEPWLSLMANSSATRRALFHMHEECGPQPVGPKSYCESDLMLKNLASMGLAEAPIVEWGGGLVPDGLSIVISTAAPACPNDRTRAYHNSVATDVCAPLQLNITALWTALFTGLAHPRQQRPNYKHIMLGLGILQNAMEDSLAFIYV